MNADQARMLMEYMTKLWEGEFPATCKVLAAVPDAKRDYKPDDKSRTAWDLTVHLAAGDLWFLDSIRDRMRLRGTPTLRKPSSRSIPRSPTS